MNEDPNKAYYYYYYYLSKDFSENKTKPITIKLLIGLLPSIQNMLTFVNKNANKMPIKSLWPD